MEAPGNFPFLPVVVGVTGHRDPRPQDEVALKRAVGIVLGALRDKRIAGRHLVLASALAEGADQLAAEVALEFHPPIPLIAIAPMPFDEYAKTFATREGRRRLHEMWERASLRIELPWIPNKHQDSEAQYEQLGLVLSRHSHILLALWDGHDPGADRLRGGTAQIVAMRRMGERKVAAKGFAASALFPRTPPQLELTRSGPTIQIVTPRRKHHEHEDRSHIRHEAGFIFGLSDAISATEIDIENVSDLTEARAESFPSFAAAKEDFLRMAEANEDLQKTENKLRDLCRIHESYLLPPTSECSEPLSLLRSLQARADVTAARFQRYVLGEWAPGLSWSDSYKGVRDRGAWLLQPGVLLLFATVVPFGVFWFEAYAHLHLGWAALALYIALFGGSFAFYLFAVRPWRWQERFQDYRALAEALRVQFYWAACGVPIAVSDNYLRQHADELGWIRQALRGPALLAIVAANASKSIEEHRAAFLHWTNDQHAFFLGTPNKRGKSEINRRAKEWIDRLVRLTLIIAGLTALVTLGIEIFQHRNPHVLPKQLDDWHDLQLLVLGLLPAVAAAFLIITESRAYEAHAHAYARAGLLQKRANEIASELHEEHDHDTWRSLVFELGQEALAENARWLANRRERRIASRIG
jgi:hypothetical protein